jgi:hypothetical protein
MSDSRERSCLPVPRPNMMAVTALFGGIVAALT